MGIWGLDERLDYYDIENQQVRENTECVAAICLKGDLRQGKAGFYTLPVRNFGESYNLVRSERFRDQPAYNGFICTAFLVEEDVIATASHCLDNYPLSDYRFIFGFKMLNSLQAVTDIPDNDIYRAVKIIDWYSPDIHNLSDKLAPQPSWALVRLDRRVTGKRVAKLSKSDLPIDQGVYMIGHPCGLPLKVAPGASVFKILNNCFVADLDSFAGNSGSPIFDGKTHEVVGLLSRTDSKDFRETHEGVFSVIYPSYDEISYGPICTGVSAFISYIDPYFYEKELRKAVEKGLYLEGKENLMEIMRISPERQERLKKEFGYIYDFENPDKDENNWKQKEGQIDWRRKLWRILSLHGNFEFIAPNLTESSDSEKEETDSAKKEIVKPVEKDLIPSEEKGEGLERAVFALFKELFERCEPDESFQLISARQQDRGRQSGHDLKFVCEITGSKILRFLIECKNYSRKITLDNIAGKLLAAEAYNHNTPIDHWILVSPNANVSNELDKRIESWEKEEKYPFKVQVWTPAESVEKFFGLIPEFYSKFIIGRELDIHPKDWDEKKRQEVIASWKKKLEPPLRLPNGWKEYLHDPSNLFLNKNEKDFEIRYSEHDYVDMNCLDETGALLPQSLEEKVLSWLEEPKSPTLFLLGEFGDGKTFFTYILTRKLVERFKQSPRDHWLPVHFALKNFESGSPKSIQDFLELHLKNFRADIAGWNELRNKGHKILAILDGFDEISNELDPQTIHRNISILTDCFESDYFSGTKLLITSRKHFFDDQKGKDWLIDKLDNPRLLHLAPIDRATTEKYLREYAVKEKVEEKFNKLIECHDPIEMASKPFFLEMIRGSLKKLLVENLNEYILYDTYVRDSLERKKEYRDDKTKQTLDPKITDNLLHLLGVVAQELYQSKREFVYLSDIRGNTEIKEWLWDLDNPDKETTEDETTRAATRSLLKRVEVKNQPGDKKWPVDFCHRSIREYFVAGAVCNSIEKSLEEAGEFLRRCFLSHEILFFAGEIMKNKEFDYEPSLIQLIKATRAVENINRINCGYLGGNAVNLLYRYKGKLPGDDWTNLILNVAILPNADLSGKDFSGTTFQYANLDNVNLSGANFSNCDLTEVRIEETTPVESVAVAPDRNILALYRDGVMREWVYQHHKREISSHLAENIKGKNLKLIALPGNDLTVMQAGCIHYYDRISGKFELKAEFETRPDIHLIKANRKYLLLNEKSGIENRVHLVDLDKEAIIRTRECPPFALCDHFDDHGLIIIDQNEKVKFLDFIPSNDSDYLLPILDRVTCLATCKCENMEDHYLLALGLHTGIVQVWQIQVKQRQYNQLLEKLLHKQNQAIKDIAFVDDSCIVTGGLDKAIKLLKFNQGEQTVGDPIEFKLALQCRGMKIDGVIRENIEQKKLKELLENAR